MPNTKRKKVTAYSFFVHGIWEEIWADIIRPIASTAGVSKSIREWVQSVHSAVIVMQGKYI